MHYEKIPYISSALMFEYTQILCEVFPGIVTIEAFAQAFNDLNFGYQGLNKHKLDPVSIMAKQVSCSSTALLMGLSETLREAKPKYRVEKVITDPEGLWQSRDQEVKKKTRAHTL